MAAHRRNNERMSAMLLYPFAKSTQDPFQICDLPTAGSQCNTVAWTDPLQYATLFKGTVDFGR